LAQSDRFWILMVGLVLDLLRVALNLFREQRNLPTQWLECRSQRFREQVGNSFEKIIRTTGR
jgi:hypothetical protein